MNNKFYLEGRKNLSVFIVSSLLILSVFSNVLGNPIFINNGKTLIRELKDLTDQAKDPNIDLPTDVIIKIDGVITLEDSPAIFAAYTDPVTNKCDGTNITIESKDPNNPAVIDGINKSALLVISNCGSNSITLKNIIFQNGLGSIMGNGSGSVILEAEDGAILLEGNKFLNNKFNVTRNADGGVFIQIHKNGKIIVNKNRFLGNSGDYSGALLLKGWDISIKNNLFSRNKVYSLDGGALTIANIAINLHKPIVIITNNTFYGNFGEKKQNNAGNWDVTKGVAISLGYSNNSQNTSTTYIANNIIYNNGVNTDINNGNYKGLQVYISNAYTPPNKANKVIISANIIGIDKGLFKKYGKDLDLNLTTGQSEQFWIEDNSNIGFEHGLGKHIFDNPLLINPLPLDENVVVDYKNSNYRLKPNSPAVDTGIHNSSPTNIILYPTDDIDNNKRPIDGDGDGIQEYDIGFDELAFKKLKISVQGNGKVIYPSDSSKINCPEVKCSIFIHQYADVDLKAIPDAGYKIGSWNGDCSHCIGEICNIKMHSDVNCSINFIKTSSGKTTLNIDPKPVNGTVKTKNTPEINCGTKGSDCSYQYDTNDSVTLEAIPDSGYIFETWDGDCSILCSKKPICDLKIPQGVIILNCSAKFKPQNKNQFSFEINVVGKGKITIKSQKQNLNDCSSDLCRYDLYQGDTVTLEAIADNNYTFKEWQEDCNQCSNNAVCKIQIDGNKKCVGIFEESSLDDGNSQNNNPGFGNNTNTSKESGGGGCSTIKNKNYDFSLILFISILALISVYKRR